MYLEFHQYANIDREQRSGGGTIAASAGDQLRRTGPLRGLECDPDDGGAGERGAERRGGSRTVERGAYAQRAARLPRPPHAPQR